MWENEEVDSHQVPLFSRCTGTRSVDDSPPFMVSCSPNKEVDSFSKLRGEERKISTTDYRANDRIRARKVRLIDPDGENQGVVSIQDAQRAAEEAGLDLVEVAPNANPPVCRVMDLGKFLYQQEKKQREARKSSKKVEVKEIRLRPKTSDHHRSFKVRDARRWLEKGNKVKVRIQFRGREVHYPEIALEIMEEIADELDDVGMIEHEPSREGRSMLMILSPDKGD